MIDENKKRKPAPQRWRIRKTPTFSGSGVRQPFSQPSSNLFLRLTSFQPFSGLGARLFSDANFFWLGREAFLLNPFAPFGGGFCV